jgi:hypothetical protein
MELVKSFPAEAYRLKKMRMNFEKEKREKEIQP